MKKIGLQLIIILLTSTFVIGQNWKPQESGVNKALYDVDFTDLYTGFAIGEYGTILKTTNGGLSWKQKNSKVFYHLVEVQFPTSLIGYASGERGTFTKTTDGGENWKDMSLHFDMVGGGMFFVNENKGFLAEGEFGYKNSNIVMTLNGGSSWDTVYSTVDWISYLFFPDAINGYATVSNGTVLKTTDGGATWRSMNTGSSMWISAVYFHDSLNGFVGGGEYPSGGAIFKTSDGGKNWTQIPTTNAVAKMYFADANTGWAITTDVNGAYLEMLKTIDGGKTWKSDSIQGATLNGIYFQNVDLGYAVGNAGKIYKWSRSYKIKGQLTNGGNPVTSGFVKLFEFTTKQKSVLVDSVGVDNLGNYSFSGLHSGKYILFGKADAVTYPNLVGTYYGNVDYWDSAAIINMYNNDSFIANIGLIEYKAIPVGSASIEGYLSSLDGTRAGSDPIKDVDVTLKKVPGGEAKKEKTDHFGKFRFDGLDLGDYYISIDIPGLPMDSFRNMQLGSADTNLTNINFGVDSVGIHVDNTLSVFESIRKSNFKVYPNPFNDQLIIEGSYLYVNEIIITNLLGEVVFRRNGKYTTPNVLDLEFLKEGIYFISISDNEGISTLKLLKQ